MENEAVVLADRDGVIRLWSNGAQQRFGHVAEHVIGKTLDAIVPPEYREAHWTGFHRAMATGAASVEGQTATFAVLHADGGILEAQARLTLLRKPQGEVIAAVVVFADVG